MKTITFDETKYKLVPVEPTDPRPANCTHRMRDEGKAYPRSSCIGCGATIVTGLGRVCKYAAPEAGR